MTNEQREAIEDVEEFNNKFDCGKYRKSIDTVLSLIKEQQEEIEKKDKQIDLMADKLVEAHEWFYSEFDNFTKEDFIKYFASLVEKE